MTPKAYDEHSADNEVKCAIARVFHLTFILLPPSVLSVLFATFSTTGRMHLVLLKKYALHYYISIVWKLACSLQMWIAILRYVLLRRLTPCQRRVMPPAAHKRVFDFHHLLRIEACWADYECFVHSAVRSVWLHMPYNRAPTIDFVNFSIQQITLACIP